MYFSKILLFAVCFFIAFFTACNKYSNDQNRSKWDNRNLSYLLKMDSVLTNYLFIKGENFTNDSLIKLLEPYKAAAWSDDSLKYHRTLYYYYLATNADNLNKGGLMVFYANKYRKEVGDYHPRATIPILFMLNYYFRIKDFVKIINIFEVEKGYLRDQSTKIKNEPFNTSRYRNLISIYTLTGQAYLENSEISRSKEILKVVRDLEATLKNTREADEFDKAMAFTSATLLEESIHLHEEKPESIKENISLALERLKLLEKNRPEESLLFQGYLKELLLKYYNHTKEYDKVLEVLNSMNFSNPEFKKISSEQKATVFIQSGKYKEAFELLLYVNNLKREENIALITEVNELLNSHIEAEFNKLELQKAEKEKQNRMRLIISISVVSLFLLTLLYYLLGKEKRQLKKLTKITDIQISEAMQRAVQEERKKMGQDLHDDLSSSLATLMFNIEHARLNQENKAKTSVLNTTYDELQAIYSVVRAKSHHNFYAVEDTDEDHLDESVRKIVNTALNDSIKREIDIDKNASILLNTATRIEFLRIIQEAMANIVKHAKKVTEVFIYLYEDEGNIYLEIGDNGVPSNSKNRNGIGILSITERVKKLEGQILISNEGDGFHIEIKVPYGA